MADGLGQRMEAGPGCRVSDPSVSLARFAPVLRMAEAVEIDRNCKMVDKPCGKPF